MKVIQEIRLENLRALLSESGGSVVKLAAKLERSQPQVSQLLRESEDKNGKKKQIGDAQARYIESRFKKERGWMDNDHASLAGVIAAAIAANPDVIKASDTYIEENLPKFVRPDSPLGLRVRKETIVRNIAEPGDQLDIFRDQKDEGK